MKRDRRPLLLAWILASFLGAVGCGTGSTGFDEPPEPIPSDGEENRLILEVLGSGRCDGLPAGGATESNSVDLVLCSNDPPAGIVSETLFVADRPLRCPSEGCPLDLEIPEAGIPPGTVLLGAWRVAEGGASWRTANETLRADTRAGLLRGELRVPEPAVPTEIQVALLIYPAGFAVPMLPAEGLLVTSLTDLGAPQVSLRTAVVQPLDGNP